MEKRFQGENAAQICAVGCDRADHSDGGRALGTSALPSGDVGVLGTTDRARLKIRRLGKRFVELLVLASPFAMAWTLAILALAPPSTSALATPHPAARPGRRPAGRSSPHLSARRVRDDAMACWQRPGSRGLDRPRATRPSGYIVAGNGDVAFDTDHFLGTMAMIGASRRTNLDVMLLSGRWKPERTWIDCAGRLLGWFYRHTPSNRLVGLPRPILIDEAAVAWATCQRRGATPPLASRREAPCTNDLSRQPR